MKATPYEQRQAQLVAQLMRNYDDLWQQAANTNGSESDCVYEQIEATASVIMLYINCFGNWARFLQLVAEVLDGKKLHGAPHDELIKKAVKTAVKKAIQKRHRKNRKTGHSGLRVSDLRPPFPEIDALYGKLAPKGTKRDERQVRRRLKALGQGTSLTRHKM